MLIPYLDMSVDPRMEGVVDDFASCLKISPVLRVDISRWNRSRKEASGTASFTGIAIAAGLCQATTRAPLNCS